MVIKIINSDFDSPKLLAQHIKHVVCEAIVSQTFCIIVIHEGMLDRCHHLQHFSFGFQNQGVLLASNKF